VAECFCVGPQNGEPLCPCRMRHVQVKDGRYVETIDHGPAPGKSDTEDYSWVKADISWGPPKVTRVRWADNYDDYGY
jgi:hypothetical protein